MTIRIWHLEEMKKTDFIPLKIDIKSLPEEQFTQQQQNIPLQDSVDVFNQDFWFSRNQVVPEMIQNDYAHVTCMVICEDIENTRNNFIVAGYASNQIIRYSPLFIKPQNKKWQKTVVIYKRLRDHLDSVTSLDFSSKYLASSSTDMSVIIQDIDGTNNRQFFFNEMISKVKFNQAGDKVLIMAYTCEKAQVVYTHIYEWSGFKNTGSDTIRKFKYPWNCDFGDICQIYPIFNNVYVINIGNISKIADLQQTIDGVNQKLELMTERKMNFSEYFHFQSKQQKDKVQVLVSWKPILYRESVIQYKQQTDINRGPIFPEDSNLNNVSDQKDIPCKNFWVISKDESQIKKMKVKGNIHLVNDQQDNLSDTQFEILQGITINPSAITRGRIVDNQFKEINELVRPSFSIGIDCKDALLLGGELLYYVQKKQQS